MGARTNGHNPSARFNRHTQAMLRGGLTPRQIGVLRNSLLRHYGDLGPQYPILVERLVQAHARAVATDHDADATPQVWATTSDQVLRAVASLQRYTESLKTEVLARERKEAVVRVVEIIEQVVLPQAPQLWNDVMAAIAERAPSLE